MDHAIKIVIADDHPIVREGIATVLGHEEHIEVVGQASNGKEAVDMVLQLKPNVVLMDLQMPVMTGVEAIQILKREIPSVGIIILTTFDTDDHIFGGIEAGAQAYLLKDSPPDEVIKAIEAVYRGESLIQPSVARRLLDHVSQMSKAPQSEQQQTGVLSPREVEVVELMAKGASNKSIASQLFIGESTVKTHIIHIFNKLDVRDRTEAVAKAVKEGIIQL